MIRAVPLELSRRCWPKQTIKFLLGNLITFARSLFQARNIQNGNAAAAVGDQPGSLQSASRDCHARPPYAEHHRQELVRQQKLVRIHSVIRHQEPPATTSLQRMVVVASRRLHDLIKKCMGIMNQDCPQGRALVHCFREKRRFHPQSFPRNLYVHAGRPRLSPNTIGSPTMPSFPIVPTSEAAPLCIVLTSEPTPV